MSRSTKLALVLTLFASTALADDQALWREYGLLQTHTGKLGRLVFTAYQLKDVTGALAAWEWLRSPNGRSCDLSPFCTKDVDQTVIMDDNYVVVFQGAVPTKTQVQAVLNPLPDKRDTSLPPILTFLPRQGLVPDSARYVLGPASLQAFAPQLAGTNPGFDEDAEAQLAEYKLPKSTAPVRLAIFYYPAPEMARLHTAAFKRVPHAYLKRSNVLVAIVLPPATQEQADTLLSRVQYQAKIDWNQIPPPSPIKPLLQLLINITYLSLILLAVCVLAGFMYAGMRIYRRRYGTLEADESMITLHLTLE